MNNKNSIFNLSLSYGVISGLLITGYSILLYVLNQEFNFLLSSLSYLIILLCIIFCIRTYKKANNDLLSFSEGFKLGFFVTLITSLIYSIIIYLYIKFIDIEIIIRGLESQRNILKDKGFSEEQINEALKVYSNLNTPESIVLIGFISTLFVGVVISLILANILKKNSL